MLSGIWGNLIIHILTTEMSTTLWKIVWQFLKKKIKHELTIWLRNGIVGHLSLRTRNFCLHRNLYMNVHSSFIYDIPNLEITHLLLWLGNGQTKYDISIPQYQQEEGINFETTYILYGGSITRSLC